MKSILVLAAAVAIGAPAAYAQSGNGSDVTGPVGGIIAGGSFVPLPSNGGGGFRGAGGFSGAATTAAFASIGSTASAFSSGLPQTSAATGQTIPAPAVAAIGALLTSGSPASVVSVGASLTAGGATPASVGTLMEALVALSGASESDAPTAIVGALNAFNGVVASAPASFLRNPPANFVALQAALSAMGQSLAAH